MRTAQYRLWLEYASRFRDNKAKLAGAVIAGIAQSAAWVPFAVLLRQIFDVIMPARNLPALWTATAELFGLQIATLVLSWWIGVTALRVSQDVLFRLRRDCIQRLYELPRSFHTAADVEKLHVTIVYETNWIDGMNTALTANLLPAGLASIALFLVLFRIEPRYALIIAVSAPALFVVNRLLVRKVWFRQELLRRAFENFSRGVRFALSAMDLTKFQAAEAGELGRQAAHIGNLRKVSVGLNRLTTGQQMFQSALLLSCTLTVLLAGGWAVAEGRATRGQIMAFYVVAALFASQTRTVVDAVPAVRMGMRAFAQVAGLLDVPEREPYQGLAQVSAISELRAENVVFSYPGGAAVIDGASLRIGRGETIAMLGANGGGKSTLLFLLTGFYRPARGALSVNGLAYDEVDVRSLRSRIAIVPQHPFLFSDTVRANLVYGHEEAAEPAIQDALRLAGATDFVAELPEGLETQIGESGVRLSGGQRQRLVIARALLRRPDVLILDEPTNHLDEEGIAALMHHLQHLDFRPAVVIISHEWRVLRYTSRAWRLVDGRLEESALEHRS